MTPKKLEELTIHIYESHEGGYKYDIYIGSPEEASETVDSEDGGHCTGTMSNALDMAHEQALDIIKRATITPEQVATSDEARQYAVDWQYWASEQDMSYGELLEWNKVFVTLTERFPELVDEFTENGLI